MQTVIVTGASRGLGAHIASKLIAQGNRVIGLARGSGDSGFPIYHCDISDPLSVKAAAVAIGKEQQIYGVVNAAGVAAMNLAISTPTATIQKVVNINLLGTIYVSQAFAPLMMRGRKGRIVNFSTIAVPLALAGESVYVASKAGVEGFSRAFAREVADFNITVNCVAPGPIDTDLIAKVPVASIDKIVARQVVRRKGTPNDIWNVVSFLLGPEADMVSGQVINVGGV